MRQIKQTKNFDKRFVKFAKRHADLADKLGLVLEKLQVNVFDVSLKTHKLSGELSGIYACSIDYQYRLTFVFDDESVFLYSIGSHDEVY
jgi:addiction module RelE/StbE family toxin